MPGAGNRRENEETRQPLEALVNQPGAAENDNAAFLKHTLMDSLVTEKKVQRILGSYQPSAAYPGNAFAASLKNIAGLIAAGLPTRVYFVSLSGFDTHSNQANQQANLLTSSPRVSPRSNATSNSTNSTARSPP